MKSEKYSFKMGYVPLADEIYIPKTQPQTAKISAVAQDAPPRENPVNEVSMAAIQSMLSMCGMVYMMCLSVLGDETVFAEEDIDSFL